MIQKKPKYTYAMIHISTVFTPAIEQNITKYTYAMKHLSYICG